MNLGITYTAENPAESPKRETNLPCLQLERISKGDFLLRVASKNHYTEPGGFVGRFLAYAIWVAGQYLGVIVAGSATMHLVGRNEFFGNVALNSIINNTLFHIEKPWGVPPFCFRASEAGIKWHENRLPYPLRNLTTRVLSAWRQQSVLDWQTTYGDEVVGFETLVQLPRTGEVYRRDGWTLVGETKGFSCKRVGGSNPTERFDGRRVWTFDPLKRKLVFCRKATEANG